MMSIAGEKKWAQNTNNHDNNCNIKLTMNALKVLVVYSVARAHTHATILHKYIYNVVH